MRRPGCWDKKTTVEDFFDPVMNGNGNYKILHIYIYDMIFLVFMLFVSNYIYIYIYTLSFQTPRIPGVWKNKRGFQTKPEVFIHSCKSLG